MKNLLKHRLGFTCFVLSLLLFSPAVTRSQDEKKGAEAQDSPRPENKITSFEELAKAYESQNIKFEKNAAAESLLFRTSRNDFKGVMVAKWDGVNGVLHLIQTWPLKVPKEKTDLYLKAAQTLNHGFLFPGIGINLSNGGTYYRLSVPIAPRGYLHNFEVGTYTRFTINKSAEFMPTMQSVMDGKVTTDELVLYHQKYLRSLAAKKKPEIKLTGSYTRMTDGAEWVLDFSKPGKVQVFRGGKLGVESKVVIKGDECKIEDTGGPLASKDPGSYRIVMTGEKLTFRAIEDKAEERKSVLTGGVWSAKK